MEGVMPVLIIFGGIVLLGAIILIIVGIKSPKDADPLGTRLAEYASRGEPVSLEEIELSQPFTERIIYPLARSLGVFAIRFTPQNAINNMSRKLELAGNPGNLDPAIVFALRFFGLPLGGIFIFLDAIASPGTIIDGKGLYIA